MDVLSAKNIIRVTARTFTIAIIAFLSSCDSSSSSKTGIEKNIQENSNKESTTEAYNIINSKATGINKCTIEVGIEKKLSATELQKIAQKIKSGLDARFEIIYIFFLLPEMNGSNGAWARITFDPEMKMEIIGQTIEQEHKIKHYLAANHEKFIGQWTDNFLQFGLIHRMRNEKGKIILEVFSPADDSASILSELVKVKRGNEVVYKAVDNDFGEYYIINKNKELEVYDSHGYVMTYAQVGN